MINDQTRLPPFETAEQSLILFLFASWPCRRTLFVKDVEHSIFSSLSVWISGWFFESFAEPVAMIGTSEFPRSGDGIDGTVTKRAVASHFSHSTVTLLWENLENLVPLWCQ